MVVLKAIAFLTFYSNIKHLFRCENLFLNSKRKLATGMKVASDVIYNKDKISISGLGAAFLR